MIIIMCDGPRIKPVPSFFSRCENILLAILPGMYYNTTNRCAPPMLRETIPFRPDPSVPTRHGKHICRYDGIGRRSGLKIRRQRWRAGSTPATGTTSAHLAHGSENPIAFRGRVFCVWASWRLLSPQNLRFCGDPIFRRGVVARSYPVRTVIQLSIEAVLIRFFVQIEKADLHSTLPKG